jgi:Helix-turn-helix domain
VSALRALALVPVVRAPEGQGGRAVSQTERRRKSLLAAWRDVVCESELGRTSKLVALVLSTFMDGRGFCFPSQDLIASRASLSDRGVHLATLPLEEDGFLVVDRSQGRSSHGYQATLPPTANALRRSEWEAAGGNSEPHDTNSERDDTNSERRSPESVESAESGALRAAAAAEGGAASAQKFDPEAVEEAAAKLA